MRLLFCLIHVFSLNTLEIRCTNVHYNGATGKKKKAMAEGEQMDLILSLLKFCGKNVSECACVCARVHAYAFE